jgi:hypothetical protein
MVVHRYLCEGIELIAAHAHVLALIDFFIQMWFVGFLGRMIVHFSLSVFLLALSSYSNGTEY